MWGIFMDAWRIDDRIIDILCEGNIVPWMHSCCTCFL